MVYITYCITVSYSSRYLATSSTATTQNHHHDNNNEVSKTNKDIRNKPIQIQTAFWHQSSKAQPKQQKQQQSKQHLQSTNDNNNYMPLSDGDEIDSTPTVTTSEPTKSLAQPWSTDEQEKSTEMKESFHCINNSQPAAVSSIGDTYCYTFLILDENGKDDDNNHSIDHPLAITTPSSLSNNKTNISNHNTNTADIMSTGEIIIVKTTVLQTIMMKTMRIK